MPLPLLGFKGKRKAGKDTIAKILVEQHGFRREAFADALKLEIFWAFGRDILRRLWEKSGEYPTAPYSFEDWVQLVDQHKNDPADSDYGWLGPLLQFWATEYRREKCGQTYWLDKVAPRLGPGVVVTDVRFQNEADLIRQHGGLIIHISRPALDQQDDGAARGSSHVSESGIDAITADFTFVNDETWDRLPEQVATALRRWKRIPA